MANDQLQQFNITQQNANVTQNYEGSNQQVFIIYSIMFLLFAAQTALFVWRRYHQRSYNLVTLIGLWLVPPILDLLIVKAYFFILTWILYSVVTVYLLIQCQRKQIPLNLPRQVYAWFWAVFKFSFGLGVTGYVFLLLFIFGISFERILGYPHLLFLWYGMYFGIMSRDCAEIASDFMALKLGIGRNLGYNTRNCAMCQGPLQYSSNNQMYDRSKQSLFDENDMNANNNKNDQKVVVQKGAIALPGEQIITLNCKHCFHELCLKGWTIIGKKDVCPVCLEKVDLKRFKQERPWEIFDIQYMDYLHTIRYFVVWLPIIITLIYLGFYELGLSKYFTPVDAQGQELKMNNTTATKEEAIKLYK